MKIFISGDIEGISSIVNQTHTNQKGVNYQRARKLMTDEVNAAIAGAVKAGAKEIVVNDSHGSMTNLLIEDLNPLAKLITGSPKALGMMEGIDDSFDGAIFVGYHARMNTPGVLSHSYDGRVISNIAINGIDVGEFALNALLAGFYHVPVVAVTGDNILAQEVQAWNDTIESIVVKTARSRFAAECIHPAVVGTMIENQVKDILLKKETVKLCTISSPVDLEVTFINSGMAEAAAIMPGAELVAPNQVYYQAKDILNAYRARTTMTSLANQVFE